MELVTNKSYYQCGDFNYTAQPLNDHELNHYKVITCQLEFIPWLFQEIINYPDKKYVVVSADSDVGLVYQQEHHPNADLIKMFNTLDWSELSKNGKYNRVLLESFDKNHCHPDQMYALKVYAYTYGTFSSIPYNIKAWFCSNLNVAHPLITPIPMGVNPNTVKDLEYVKGLCLPTENTLYVNFHPNTIERMQLQRHYKSYSWVTKKENVGQVEYFCDIKKSKFVLCPAGNGLDTHRVMETLYLGAIPIMLKTVFSRITYKDFPVLLIDNLDNLNPDWLNKQYDMIQADINREGDNLRGALDFGYWKGKIANAALSI